MQVVIETFYQIMGSLPHFALLFIGLFLTKLVYDWTTPYKLSVELTERDNPAVGVSLGGYILGAGIALSGVAVNFSLNPLQDWLETGLAALTIIVLMRLSVLINDAAVLYKFSISKEMVEDRNVGVGFVVAGGSIATGLILNGVLSGHNPSLGPTIRDICFYWALGQAILVLGGIFLQRITSYDVHKVIGNQDNMPAGISFGGFLTALGFITRSALRGATSSYAVESLTTLTLALFGLFLLLIAKIIADRVLLPDSPLAKEVVVDRNPAAGAIAAVSFIVVALLFAAAIPHIPVQDILTNDSMFKDFQP